MIFRKYRRCKICDETEKIAKIEKDSVQYALKKRLQKALKTLQRTYQRNSLKSFEILESKNPSLHCSCIKSVKRMEIFFWL